MVQLCLCMIDMERTVGGKVEEREGLIIILEGVVAPIVSSVYVLLSYVQNLHRSVPNLMYTSHVNTADFRVIGGKFVICKF